MDYLDVGFANIRLPNDEKSYIYRYDIRNNTFPEEVFVHEFLHTMERISKENGLECPVLHEYAKYGYENRAIDGQKKWYADFMTKRIRENGTYIGLDPKVYSKKPVHMSDFMYSIALDFDDNPDNIFEEIRTLLKAFNKSVSNIKEKV